MSCAIHWSEDGLVTYSPCTSEFLSYVHEAMEPACANCPTEPTCDRDAAEGCPEWDALRKWLPAEPIPEYEIRLYEPFGADKYDEHELRRILGDRGLGVYNELCKTVARAVRTALAENPRLRLQAPRNEWEENE